MVRLNWDAACGHGEVRNDEIITQRDKGRSVL